MGSDNFEISQDPTKLFAEISQAYIEILAGVRRPEQLARWLSDKIYYDVCQRAKRASRERQLTGLNSRPDIVLRKSRTFLTDSHGVEGVVLLRVSGSTRAVTIRGEFIHERFRVTELVML
ncbi:MAG: hypothetical protein RL068_1116 [Actinomycetota bacterium]|jgi:hypothetical protein